MEEDMNVNLQLQPIVALIAGVLVLIAPRLLTWIIGIYLIVIGVMGLLGK
jgi:threonine/homoserine efflux transporter RhtA